MAVDSTGRPSVLYIDQNPEDFRDEGALMFAGAPCVPGSSERIAVDGTFADRRIARPAITLAYSPHGQPVVAFRRRHGALGNYDCSVHLGRREASDFWTFDELEASGNLGLSPQIEFAADDSVRSVFHYSYSTHRIMRTQRIAADEWVTQSVGPPGTGLDLMLTPGKEGQLQIRSGVHRFNSDPAGGDYVVLNSATSEFVSQPRPLDGSLQGAVRLLSDGSTAAIVQKRGDFREGSSRMIMCLRDEKWDVLADLPLGASWSFAVLPGGEIVVPVAEPGSGSLQLWSWSEGEATTQTVATNFPEGPVKWTTCQISAAGHFVIFAGQASHQYSWLRACVPKRPGLGTRRSK